MSESVGASSRKSRGSSYAATSFSRMCTSRVISSAFMGDRRPPVRAIESTLDSVRSSRESAERAAPEGSIAASSQSGSIALGLPGDVSAEFDLSSISGRIKTGFGINADGINRTINFTLGTGDGEVRLSTTSGSVTIRKI